MDTPSGCELKYFRGSGWCPARRHIHICEQALNWGADLICIIGSDQVHPPDMFTRLIDRFQSGYEVVSALVPARGYVAWQNMKPFQPMAWRFKSNNALSVRQYRSHDLDGDMLDVIDPAAGEMQEVDFIGSGVLMFHRQHLMQMQRPWFYEKINNDGSYNRTACMDCTFVWRLKWEAHASVWVDTTIKVKHLHQFAIDDTYQHRFRDWEQGGGDPEICAFKDSPQPDKAKASAPARGSGATKKAV